MCPWGLRRCLRSAAPARRARGCALLSSLSLPVHLCLHLDGRTDALLFRYRLQYRYRVPPIRVLPPQAYILYDLGQLPDLQLVRFRFRTRTRITTTLAAMHRTNTVVTRIGLHTTYYILHSIALRPDLRHSFVPLPRCPAALFNA
ncbi:hypothetical protein L227DRAFT_350919 [Lentinus tigrinus ALCF2SS1-6]|uniref:Uncharacterized protein n=1 Tax=Lentinus tigrinus ALCF2SS1-6 TaxID=1328759 RepID=A0A5C2RRV6_9APHY|nr:hypothetical protein L227DRAFT_350919 [Lentinus tigrinus ALCF2SS1-6]